MLRIWGGGIYEDPAFFELCDQHGILVWSDFMLACGIYPQTEAFLSAMAQEADEVLKTYRNCTSIALWSGDNETDRPTAGRDGLTSLKATVSAIRC